MEKQIRDVTILKKYRCRQVVLNYYIDDDFLERREGFYVEEMHIGKNGLSFRRGNEEDISISFEDFPIFTVNSDFQNYYVLKNGSKRLEIYFP